MEVRRLGGVQDSTITQATNEILHIARIYRQKWTQLPGLRIQLNCTATRRNFHVRQFWTIEIVSMVLSDDKICYYEADEDGVTVHDARGPRAFSRWAKVSSFHRFLQSLPPLQAPQKQQFSSEKTSEVNAMTGEAPSTTSKFVKPQARDFHRESDFTQGIKTDTDDASFEMMLNDLHVPSELQYRPDEDMLATMLATGLA